MKTIGGIDIVKISTDQGSSDLSIFRDICTCELEQIKSSDDIMKLSGYYLVWYKPNNQGMSGWNIDGSMNYLTWEYGDGLISNSINEPEVSSLIQSFRKGLNKPVEILVAFDTLLNAGIIVDGTKRALALYTLAKTEKPVMEQLIKSAYPICVLRLKSAHCCSLFPCDFLKLYRK